jgi:hypothetical protein
MKSITYRRDQDAVARLDLRGDALAILIRRTRADSKDLGLVELLDGALGQEDTAGSLGLGLHALDEDAVEKRDETLDGLESGGLRGRAVSNAGDDQDAYTRAQIERHLPLRRLRMMRMMRMMNAKKTERCRWRGRSSWQYC